MKQYLRPENKNKRKNVFHYVKLTGQLDLLKVTNMQEASG